MNKKRITMMLLLTVLTTVGAYTQGSGIADVSEAAKMVASYFDPGTKLICATGAVVGLISSIKVYNKLSSGDPGMSKTIASWFGACTFPIVVTTTLCSFFP